MFSQMRESKEARGPIKSFSSPKVNLDGISSSDSLSYEVFYLGKLRISSQKSATQLKSEIPQRFIDDAVLEIAKNKDFKYRRESLTESQKSSEDSPTELGSSDNVSVFPDTKLPIFQKTCDGGGRNDEESSGENLRAALSELKKEIEENDERGFENKENIAVNTPHPLQDIDLEGHCEKNEPNKLVKCLSLPSQTIRTRAFSASHDQRMKIDNNNFNRTMILIIGNEMRLISPDQKSTVFVKSFEDICHISQGVVSKNCLGFICSESSSKVCNYVGYVFRCESESISQEILQVLNQAYSVALEKGRRANVCENCPMVIFNKLASEIEGLPDERGYLVLRRKIDGLPIEDRRNILTKLEGANVNGTKGRNEMLILLFKAWSETKQLRHHHHGLGHDSHDTRNEFLNHLGSSVMKAKKSISSSFDTLMNRKGKDFHQQAFRDFIFTPKGKMDELSGPGGVNTRFEFTASDSPFSPTTTTLRQRSSTIGEFSPLSSQKTRFVRNRRVSQTPIPYDGNRLEEITAKHSPMMNMFLKVGSQPKTPSNILAESPSKGGSWRHAIFKRVVSPDALNAQNPPYISNLASTPVTSKQRRRTKTKAEIRDLWKFAIKQQILLNRMDKENYMLKAKQQEANIKRLKLSYPSLGICDEEASDTWDYIMALATQTSNSVCDFPLLDSALLRGIPKHKRGQVWQFFIQQRSLKKDSSSNCLVNQSVPYESLLRQLTSHQHAILIDLGRTFPSHKYFSSPLGSGQLALFNLLKAYSLLDPDVGYCQGLSFVAGLLLMHLEEEEAFNVLKYFMFDLGAREHYKADMHGLQVKLYQLTRMIHDADADIQYLLYNNDVPPSLYAAPWFLTIFASQFPIGFAIRVLDLVLLHGVDIIAKFALVIILDHKKELMECSGLEQIMDCFKSAVTKIGSDKVDKYLRRVVEMESEKQLLTYLVEYSVMHDETFLAFLNDSSFGTIGPKGNREKWTQTEGSNEFVRNLIHKNEELEKEILELKRENEMLRKTQSPICDNMGLEDGNGNVLDTKAEFNAL